MFGQQSCGGERKGKAIHGMEGVRQISFYILPTVKAYGLLQREEK